MSRSDQKQTVSREEAIDLLFLDQGAEDSIDTAKDHEMESFFDKYGNYIFPTDYVLDAPNQAYGAAGAILMT